MSYQYDNWQQGPPFPWWWLFYWLGPVQIPPLAANFGMTDRAAGTIYYPSVTADGSHITFTNTPPSSSPATLFAPYDGPFVGQFGARLGVSNAHLVTEPFDADGGPGPFVRCTTNQLLAAVFFLLAAGAPSVFDHLAFQSAPVQGSIFDPTP